MRILIIAQFFEPDITAAAFRLTDLSRLLCTRGHEVKVITAVPHRSSTDVTMAPGVPEGVCVIRCPIRPLRHRGRTSYLRHYVSFVRSSSLKGLGLWRTGWRPDVIFASSPPLFVGMTGMFLARLFRRPLVFEVRDIWPEGAVDAGQVSPTSLNFRLGRLLELHLYRHARHITCVSQAMKRYVESQCQTPVTVVYNGVSTPPGWSLSRPQIQHPRDRVIVYAGNIGLVQDLEILVNAICDLRQQGSASGWQVQIVGEGARKQDLQALVASRNAGDFVEIAPSIPREEARVLLSRSAILFLNLRSTPNLARTIPSKVFDYLQAGRPILAGIAGEGREILESTGANLCFRPGDTEDLKAVLVRMLAEYGQFEALAHRNVEFVTSQFSRERSVDQLLKALDAARGA